MRVAREGKKQRLVRVSQRFLSETVVEMTCGLVHAIYSLPFGQAVATVSDKNSWDTLTKRCFFPSRAPLVPLKVVYRGLVTKSCTPTLRGQGDPKVSQPF